MTTVYNLCKLLIQKNRTDGLQEKMDVYLAALWNAKDYQGMIELMENAADPGPINGEKPSDHE